MLISCARVRLSLVMTPTSFPEKAVPVGGRPGPVLLRVELGICTPDTATTPKRHRDDTNRAVPGQDIVCHFLFVDSKA